jgi:heme A synthase
VSAIVVYSAIVAILAAITVSRRIPRPRWLQAAAWTLQALVIGQAVLATITIIRGQGPARPGLFLAYLAVAVALLPVCGAMAPSDRGSSGPDVRLTVAAAIGVVVQWRLVATWRSGSA